MDFGTLTWDVTVSGAPYFTLGAGETATKDFGVLQPGECKDIAWWLNFRCLGGNGCSGAYNFSVTSSVLGVVEISPIRICTSLSASGSGFTGTPPNINYTGGIGGAFCYTVTHGASRMQPGEQIVWSGAGTRDLNGGCLEQLSACVVGGVTAADCPVPLGCNTQTYVNTTGAQCGSNPAWGFTVQYCYRVLCDVNFIFRPYTEAYQGGNFQYSLGGNGTITVNPAANSTIGIAKSAFPNSNLQLNDIVTYTIVLTNPTTYPMSLDKVVDVMPSQLQFQSFTAASTIKTTDLSGYPATGSTGTMEFLGGGTASSLGYPNIYVPPGSSVTIQYTAKVVDDSQPIQVVNTAQGHIVGSLTTPQVEAYVAIGQAFLPIQLAFFGAKVEGKENTLFWTTSSEMNSKYFEIERSSDGSRFEKIGTMNAAGTSLTESNYMFHDLNPTKRAFYRLKMIDIDGKSKYSSLRELRRLSSITEFVMAPNPTSQNVVISLFDNQEDIEVSVRDLYGNVLLNTTRASFDTQTIELNTSELSKGIYLVTIQAGTETITKKLMA
ncbi:MAG: T9SS type A sorting domain-containing protein [Saprospiraceae bacterium]|nr:T9SS type A sorting domain-containing protein [Saprospiraceae bacterium]